MSSNEQDIYTVMQEQGGYSHEEIQSALRPELEKAGFADQEIAEYFNNYTDVGSAGADDAGLWNFFVHGLQGSVSRLWARETLPDAVGTKALENALVGWIGPLFQWDQSLAIFLQLL